ncbi:MAG TPA: hypothetical protein VFC19_34475 [Candidatus Limnocylindrales bacterium]|nr:hypothetical protein [Candidatus Limnocylindrales bacterium]
MHDSDENQPNTAGMTVVVQASAAALAGIYIATQSFVITALGAVLFMAIFVLWLVVGVSRRR